MNKLKTKLEMVELNVQREVQLLSISNQHYQGHWSGDSTLQVLFSTSTGAQYKKRSKTGYVITPNTQNKKT